ncbi:MAG TPA: DNA-3-methyladenine glycosylase [Thermoanaerobaculia bacterium]|nr:DNA-3-methyladenine glycosylase [Thermoanaerobaculia bacterium]HUM28877.1 DNA-3-methyladenine glycosylase [Thermoanaerobaculia bacterium]HXK67190.1 DNA-3-methyladenine glycosylase [Thermoanaerobaculia bacterium]
MNRHDTPTNPEVQSALPPEFYRRDTEQVAEDLLGCFLFRALGDEIIAGMIVETEAYLGERDPACHSFRGRTPRVEPMFRAGGVAYVYFVYGMHFCANVVTRGEGEPEAVLIRALHPVKGIETMRKRRMGRVNLSSGPAVLCQALAIDGTLNGHPLHTSPLWIEGRTAGTPFEIDRSPRVGVDYAGKAALWPLRFTIPGNPYLSRPPRRGNRKR